MRIFVTGATGVVGSRLIPLLLGKGHDVSGVTRSPAGRDRLHRLGARPVAIDLFNQDAVRRAVEGHETIVNLATHMPPSAAKMLWPPAWRENDRLRKEASAILAHAAAAGGVTRFVQESFAPVYPDRGDRWIDETTPIEPVKYNRTVADAEASAESFSREGRIGVVLRFGAFYGHDAFQVVDLVNWVKRGWAMLPGAPDAFISSVSHDDAATAVAAAITVPAGVYNVVEDEPVTHRAYVDTLADALHVARPRLPPSWVTSLSGSAGAMLARSVRVSNRKLRSLTAWSPTFPSVREGWRVVVWELTHPGSPGRA